MPERSHILVTGGAGYIGSHACKQLSARGFTPVVYDNLVYGHREAVRWGPFEQGDLLDHRRLAEVVREYQPLAVMHFAAYAYVGESVIDPGKYYQNNLIGGLNLLQTMRDQGVRNLIFSSTCATYGEPQQIPIDEQHPQLPVNPYGTSKLMMEMMMKDFAIAHHLRYVALRYFNAAGADPDLQLGEAHNPETHLIPLVLQVALGQREQISIFGTDYDTPDGTCIRDYIHVTDLVDAHLLALDYLLDGGQSCALNLGNGNGYSVREVIDQARLVTGHAIPEQITERRPGDPPRLVADSTSIQQVLGWKPRYPDLTQMLETAWRWHQQPAWN